MRKAHSGTLTLCASLSLCVMLFMSFRAGKLMLVKMWGWIKKLMSWMIKADRVSLFELDTSRHDASRKNEQTDVRGRMEAGGGGGKHDSGALGSLIIPQRREGGWLITSICPTITDPQLIPATKEVTMARQWTASPPPNATHTTIPHRAPGSCPSTWLRPNHCDPPCSATQSKNTKSTTKRFPRTRPAHNNRRRNPSAPHSQSQSSDPFWLI